MKDKWYEDMEVCPACGSIMNFTSEVFVFVGRERIDAHCTGCGEDWVLIKPEENL